MKDQRAAAQSLQDRQAAERFAEQLRTLRTSVGDPSFRKMAGRSGRISHTTLHEAAAGTRFHGQHVGSVIAFHRSDRYECHAVGRRRHSQIRLSNIETRRPWVARF